MELKQKLRTLFEHPKLGFRGLNRLYHARFSRNLIDEEEKEIVAQEEEQEDCDIDEEAVKEKLEGLGYR